MPRRHYLISYDIADDKRRDRVFHACQDFGSHTQFSVFLAELSDAELVTLRSVIEPVIHAAEDQVLLVDLGPAHHDLDHAIDAIGRPFQPQPRAFIV
jgi:CRISPR-associated protein Cas2